MMIRRLLPKWLRNEADSAGKRVAQIERRIGEVEGQEDKVDDLAARLRHRNRVNDFGAAMRTAWTRGNG